MNSTPASKDKKNGSILSESIVKEKNFQDSNMVILNHYVAIKTD